MTLRSGLVAAVLVALAVTTGCTESPQEAVGDEIVDAVRDGGDSPVVPRFEQATVDFEEAVQAFSTSPTDTPATLELAQDRLHELRRVFDRWSPIVGEVIDRDVQGTPNAELEAWRDAAGAWIAAQEAITDAMVACDYAAACLERAQARHTPAVVAATRRAQDAKLRFLAAVEE